MNVHINGITFYLQNLDATSYWITLRNKIYFDTCTWSQCLQNLLIESLM